MEAGAAGFGTACRTVRKEQGGRRYIRFQLEQLEDAHLAIGEQEELEQEADTLSHAEEIKAGLFRAGQAMNSDEGGLLSVLKECLNTMAGLQKVYPAAGELAERLESSYIELKDISQEVSGKEEEIEFNPARLEEVNGRLNLIYTLQQKHRVSTVDELLALADDYAAKLSNITSSDEQIETLKARSEALYNKVKRQAAVLTGLRTAAAREVEKQMAAPPDTAGHAQCPFSGGNRYTQGAGGTWGGYGELPFLCQQERGFAEYFFGSFGGRDSPCHAVCQGNDSRSGEAAHYRVR